MKYKPGRVDLQELTLYNHKGEQLSIKAICPEINIFNDMSGYGTTIELILIDATSIINSFPICGDELLAITFKTPDMEGQKFNKIKYVFKITNVNTRNREDPRSETFALKGVSVEIINNITKSINKSYTNLTVDKMIKAVHNGYIKPFTHPTITLPSLPANDLVTQTKTKGEKTFVFPGVDPFKVIRQLCSEAEIDPSVDLSSGNYFKYYQNSKGWHFTTVDLLIKQDPKEEFSYSDSGVESDEFDKSQKIKSFEIEEMPNTVDNVLNGVYNQIVETIDPITKQFIVNKFNYSKDRKKFTHMEKDKFGLISSNSSFKNEFDSGKSVYVISNLGNNYSNLEYIKPGSEIDEEEIPNDYQLKNPRTVHNNIKFKKSYKNTFNLKLIINIPGNTNLEIGDTIEVILPETSEVKDEKAKNDKGLGKKYLITSVRHILTSNEGNKDFFTSLRLERNNYGFDLEPVV